MRLRIWNRQDLAAFVEKFHRDEMNKASGEITTYPMLVALEEEQDNENNQFESRGDAFRRLVSHSR